MGTEQKYYSQHIGVVDEHHYRYILSFGENNGPARVRARLPYISDNTLSSQVQLVSLERYMSGHERFINNGRRVSGLKEPFRTQWGYFQGAANEILCEEYVRIEDMSDGQALISDRVLAKAIRDGHNPGVSIEENSLNFYYGDSYMTCPDALLMALDPEGHVSLQRDYEFKSVMDGADLRGVGKNAKIKEVERMFKPGSIPCRVFREALGQVIKIPPEDIVIPSPGNLPIRLVASQRGIVTSSADYLRVRFSGGVACIDLPNIRSFAYFVLKILTDKSLEQQIWESHFTPISQRLAESIECVRA